MGQDSDGTPDAKEKTTIELQRDIKTGERWLIGITGAGVIINIVIALIYYGQLKQMRISTDAAQRSAEAAACAAKISSEALADSRKTFEIEQRPFVVLQHSPEFVNQPTANAQIETNATVQNIGKTPAFNVIWNVALVKFHPGPKNDEGKKMLVKFLSEGFNKLRKDNAINQKDLASAGRDFSPENDIAPNATMFSTSHDQIMLTPDELQQLTDVQGKTALFMLGSVIYTDSFGKPYRTEFCDIFWGPYPKIWHICDTHNTIK